MSSRLAPKNNNMNPKPRHSALFATRNRRPALRNFSRNAAAEGRKRTLARIIKEIKEKEEASIKRLKEEQKELRLRIAKNAAAVGHIKKMQRGISRSKEALKKLNTLNTYENTIRPNALLNTLKKGAKTLKLAKTFLSQTRKL
jgi:vacuolar-type H+-ATPase subunit I/STV1